MDKKNEKNVEMRERFQGLMKSGVRAGFTARELIEKGIPADFDVAAPLGGLGQDINPFADGAQCW